ncbi:MAG TPA: hypothetical protein VF618_23295 [Thermoanaerobaculia bacterium]
MNVRDRVRRVFLQPQPFYTAPEAAELLGWRRDELDAAIRDGEIEATRTSTGFHVPWQEVAVSISAKEPQAVIEKALGEHLGSVMPELVRLAELRVEIPRYQTVMLSKLAERERLSVDELLSRHLLDLAGAESDWLERAIPQFNAAMRWPEP